jgi:diacylglycerol kinase family enzyme
MKVTLLVNPSAGEGNHSPDTLRRTIESAGHRVEVGPTRGEGLQQVLERADGLVVAAGGDGTVGRVIKALVGRNLPLAILPLGTANNIAASLGIRGAAEALMARWATSARVHVQVGSVRGPWGETAFVESMGLGLLARLISPAVGDDIDDLEQARDEACRLARSMPVKYWRVELDGKDCSGEYLLIEAMNIRCAGPNICFAARAEPGSGPLEVVFAGERERATLQALVRNEKTVDTVLLPHAGRRLRMWCEPDELHVDDMHGGHLCESGGLMQIDVELTGCGVDVLV